MPPKKTAAKGDGSAKDFLRMIRDAPNSRDVPSTNTTKPPSKASGTRKRSRSASTSSNSSKNSSRESSSSRGKRAAPSNSAKSASNKIDVALFIFRRDLRLEDNRGLLRLREHVAPMPILPVFFFNPLQASPTRNAYFGYPCFKFMCESLRSLDQGAQYTEKGPLKASDNPLHLGGRLVCLYGSDEACLGVVEDAGFNIRAIGYNADYTPFARERDARLRDWCEKRPDVDVVEEKKDYILLPPDSVLTGANKTYAKFTPFYNNVMSAKTWKLIEEPDSTKIQVNSWFVSDGKKRIGTTTCIDLDQLLSTVDNAIDTETVELSGQSKYTPTDRGGRAEGLKRLAMISSAKNYGEDRENLSEDKTTHMSPHLKFGTVSVREVLSTAVKHLGKSHAYTRELIWREFYAMLLFNNPRLAQGQLNSFSGPLLAFRSSASVDAIAGKNQKKNSVPPHELLYAPRGSGTDSSSKRSLENSTFQANYASFKWKWEEEHFQRFQRGTTGVPLVDAAVRSLNATGWCHNRNRMVLANFLVKVLFVDWRVGERWFARRGVDFDVASNNGGWLWSSGQGADAQPFFRTFNSFLQSKRYDSGATFIKNWVPELKDVPAKDIHKWDEVCKKYAAGGSEGSGKKTNKKSSTSKKGNEKPACSYPAPMVNSSECTKKVIEEFKKY